MADGSQEHDLSRRGDVNLTADFVVAHGGQMGAEPILLGVKQIDGNDIYYVHEVSGFLGRNSDIKTYNDLEFFQTYGDPSQMVTLSEYNKELEAVNPNRDAIMEKAADIYNKAVGFGLVKDGSEVVTEEIKYQGSLNFGRLERELEHNIQKYDGIPEVVEKQINRLIDESRDLKALGSVMLSRFNDIEADVAEAGLSGAEFDGIQGSKRTFSADGLIEYGGVIKSPEIAPITN